MRGPRAFARDRALGVREISPRARIVHDACGSIGRVRPVTTCERRVFSMPKELAIALGGVLAGMVSLPLVPRDEHRFIRASGFGHWTIFTVIFLAAAVLGTVNADNPWLAARSVTLSASLLSCAFAASRLNAEGLGTVLACAECCGVMTAGLMIGQALGVAPDPSSVGRSPGALLGNRNIAAEIALLTIPLVCSAADARTRSRRYLAYLEGVALGAAIIISRTRAVWLIGGTALLLMLVVLARWRSLPHRRALVRVAVAVIAGAAVAALLPTQLAWRSESPFRDSASDLVDAT